jgi:hypothetical protein
MSHENDASSRKQDFDQTCKHRKTSTYSKPGIDAIADYERRHARSGSSRSTWNSLDAPRVHPS